MTTASLQSNPEKEPLVVTSEQIQALVEALIELGVLVHDNQGTQQSHVALTHKVNQVVSQLSGVSAAQFTSQFPVPLDVISYIEDGRNPDVYTREFVEVTAKSNARLKGRMHGFQRLRDVLGQKMAQEYPHLEPGIENIASRTER